MQKCVKSGYHAGMTTTVSHASGAPGRPPKATQAAIVEAAWALFEEVGFESASMSAIAERAGVSRRTLFNHFPHKASLLFHGSTEYMDAFREELGRQPQGGSLFTRFTNAFWALAPLSEQLELRHQPGPEVAAARMREDALAYWKAAWAREMEHLVLEVYGPEEHMKAGFVGAITAQIWTEFIGLQRRAEQPMRADTALGMVLHELAGILGVGRD